MSSNRSRARVQKLRAIEKHEALVHWDKGGMPPVGHLCCLAEPLWISGLNNAEVARHLEKSRERVHQLWRKWCRSVAHYAVRAQIPPMDAAACELLALRCQAAVRGVGA